MAAPSSDPVFNTFFCMRLAQAALGRDKVCAVQLKGSGKNAALQVSKPEHAVENFCHSLQLPEACEHAGGPGLADCFALIERISAQPSRDRLHLLDAVIFNVFIGNADAHAGTYGLLSHPRGTRFAPLARLTFTRTPDSLLAMKIGDTYSFDELDFHQWGKMADSAKFSRQYLRQRLAHFAETLPLLARSTRDALAAEKLYSPVCERIIGHIDAQAARILRALHDVAA